MHWLVCQYYGDYSDNSNNYPNILVNNNNIEKRKMLTNFLDFYKIITKDNIVFLKTFINKGELYQLLDEKAKTKDPDVYEVFSYLFGKLMFCAYNYGLKEKKGIKEHIKLFAGKKIGILELMELVRNQLTIVTFPNFLFCTENLELVKKFSEDNSSIKERMNKGEYSVIFNIIYNLSGYEPSIINIADLLGDSNKEDYIILPFTFFLIRRVTINNKEMTAEVHLLIFGRKEDTDLQIKNGRILECNSKDLIMICHN